MPDLNDSTSGRPDATPIAGNAEQQPGATTAPPTARTPGAMATNAVLGGTEDAVPGEVDQTSAPTSPGVVCPAGTSAVAAAPTPAIVVPPDVAGRPEGLEIPDSSPPVWQNHRGYDPKNPPPVIPPTAAPPEPRADAVDDPAWFEKLNGVMERKGHVNSWMACCPAHDDSSPSLGIDLKDGKFLVHCHAGCEQAVVVVAFEELGIQQSDLFLDTKPEGPVVPHVVVARYDYRDHDGKLQYQVERYEPKSFRQRRPKPGSTFDWLYNMDGVDRIMYRIPELLAADPSQWVFVVEGEKDVDNLTAAGAVATCSSGGAGKWELLSDIGPLAGRRVCIIPDDDEPGRAHAQMVAWSIKDCAAEIKIVPLNQHDVSDYLDAGVTVEALVQAAYAAPAYVPPATAPAAPKESVFGPGAFLGEPEDPTKPVPLSDEAEAVAARLRGSLECAIDLKPLYDQSPELVRRLTQLLVTLNDKMNPALSFFSSWALINGALGKRLAVVNKGHQLYPAFWLVALSPTGTGKSTMRSVQSAVQTELAARQHDTPFRFLGDHFTMSALFYQMGVVVTSARWGNMSDLERARKEADMRDECSRMMGRIMISDEFGHNLGVLLKSGVDTTEKGNLMKLADSGATIFGDTTTGGKRLMHDVCVGVVGLSQPSVWQEHFDADKHVDSGLAGRFLVADHEDYVLDVQPLQLDFPGIMTGIRQVFSDLLDRAALIGADRVVCEVNDPNDDRGAIFDALLEEPDLALIVKNGFVDMSKLKGKLIMTALKLALSEMFMRCDDNALRGLVGAPAAPGAPARAVPTPAPAVPIHDHRINADAFNAIPDEPPVAPLATARTTILYDRNVFYRHLWMLTWAAVRTFNSKQSENDMDRLRRRVLKSLQTRKDHQLLPGQLTKMNLKLNGRRLKPYEVWEIVVTPMVEEGYAAEFKAGRNTTGIRLTPAGAAIC